MDCGDVRAVFAGGVTTEWDALVMDSCTEQQIQQNNLQDPSRIRYDSMENIF